MYAPVVYIFTRGRANYLPVHRANSPSTNEAPFSYSTSSIGNCQYVNVETMKHQDQNNIEFGDDIDGEPNPIKVDVNVWQVRDQCRMPVRSQGSCL